MVVVFRDGEGQIFKEATHWESCGSDWVELLDDQENIIAVLNWRLVMFIDTRPDAELTEN